MTLSEEHPLLDGHEEGKEPPPEEHREGHVEEGREKHTEKRKLNMQKFLNSHEALVDRLTTVSKNQSQLLEHLVNHENERQNTTKELTQLMRKIGDGLAKKAEKKDEKLFHLEELTKSKDNKRNALKEIGKEVLEKKKGKLNQLTDIALTLKQLLPQQKKVEKDPVYKELPEVGVSMKIYGVSNVDTASMMYEIDLTVMIDWYDEQMKGVDEADLKDLNYAEKFFNPSVMIENAKAGYDWLEGRDEVPRFNRLKPILDEDGKTGWMKKTQRFRGELTIQEIKLETFPFDVQELPIVIKSKKCYIQLEDDVKADRVGVGKTVKLKHNEIRTEYPDEEYQAALQASESKGVLSSAPRRASMGHWIAPAVNDQLVEFEFRKIYGQQAYDKNKLRHSRTNDSVGTTSDTTSPSPSVASERKEGCLQRCKRALRMQSEESETEAARRKQKEDTYKVSIIIGRPVKSSYFFDLMVMIVLVILAITSFWDTAAPELSSRMSISLTIILTLAAYTSTRPPPIVKCPKLTFQDSYEVFSFLMVTIVSFMNLFSVTMCGGEHEEAPQYMKETYELNQGICNEGWCMSRAIDCHFLVFFVTAFGSISLAMFYWVFQRRLAISPAVRESEEDEQLWRRDQKEKEKKKKQGQSMLGGFSLSKKVAPDGTLAKNTASNGSSGTAALAHTWPKEELKTMIQSPSE